MPLDPNEAAAMRCLWATVLMHFLVEVNLLMKRRGDGPALQLKRTLGWVGTRDFREVCLLAGVDPVATEERILDAVRSRKPFLIRKEKADA